MEQSREFYLLEPLEAPQRGRVYSCCRPQTYVFTGFCGERFTAETFWPLEPKLLQERFAARPGPFTQRSAGRPRFPRHTLWSVDGAQERLQVRGARRMYERRKGVHFQGGIILMFVAQDVGQDGLGVGQVFAEGNGDRLTHSCGFWCDNNLLTLVFPENIKHLHQILHQYKNETSWKRGWNAIPTWTQLDSGKASQRSLVGQ